MKDGTGTASSDCGWRTIAVWDMKPLTCYMSKRGRASRFENRESQTRLCTVFNLPCGGFVMYLPEHPVGAACRVACGEREYQPALDIDRHFVACVRKGMKPNRCPAWDAIREVFAVANGDMHGNDVEGVAEHVDVRGEYRDLRWARVDKNDGFVGRIEDGEDIAGAIPVSLICGESAKCEIAAENAAERGNG